jgi:hypothetical protein
LKAPSHKASTYRAPVWLHGGHAQTVYALVLKGSAPVTTRSRWETPDSDFIDVDSLPERASAPLVVLFHGLEGSARSHYARALMRGLDARGWNGAVAHFRGCSGEPNHLPRAYHSGDWQEIDWVLRRFRCLNPDTPLFAVGVSMGGNALLKWLGKLERAATEVIDGAASVCAPVDLAAAGRALERGFNRVYTRHFLQTLKPAALAKLARFPGLYDRDRVLAAQTLYDFDDVVTAPLHGFRGTDDYWLRASAKPWLRRIRVPTLLLNTRNDPFLPAAFLPRHDEVSRDVLCEFPAQGGHVGFVAGLFPGHIDWLPRRLLAFFALLAGH